MMTKAHDKTGSQKPEPVNTKTTPAKKPGAGASPKPQSVPSISIQTDTTDTTKDKQSGKSHKPGVGGTAVQGAKSTQPKEIKATSPTQQETESYNREMRRRMQHMGTGPYGGSQTDAVRNRRQKRINKRKQQQEDVKKTVIAKGPSTNIKLGRKNTYFVLGLIAFLVLLIVITLIIRHPF
jgi:hypothetical protein